MFIEYGDYIGVMEDFSDVLVDYDIACEGFGSTASNVVKKGIELIQKLWNRICTYIRNKLKAFRKLIKDKTTTSGPGEGSKKAIAHGIKKGQRISISNWNLNNMAHFINKFFDKIADQITYIPVTAYSIGLSSAVEEEIYNIIEAVNSATNLVHNTGTVYEFSSIEDEAYEGIRRKLLVNTDTKEGRELVARYVNSSGLINELDMTIARRQVSTNDKLKRISGDIDKLTDSLNMIDGNILAKKELILAMRNCVSAYCRDIQMGLKKFNALFDQFTAEFEKVCSLSGTGSE